MATGFGFGTRYATPTQTQLGDTIPSSSSITRSPSADVKASEGGGGSTGDKPPPGGGGGGPGANLPQCPPGISPLWIVPAVAGIVQFVTWLLARRG